jgi:glutamate formiminotransferase/formiminotetrahydrofolate cyclodeaminase
MARLVECVPNFSEGRRPEVIDAIVEEITSVSGVRLLDRQMNADHNRAVITFIGPPEGVKEAAFLGCKKAAELIDLTKHQGEHPRMGATDVIPFIPISEVTVADCINISLEVGERIADELKIPVYLYEKSARRPERENLADVRKGEFEGIRAEMGTNPDRDPDFGEPRIHPTAGCVAVGCRDFLIAYNIDLATDDVVIAKTIADAIRHQMGGYRYCKAAGFELRERGVVQVSMNLTNYRRTPMFRVFETVKREAARHGVNVIDSEIVGLVPLEAVVDCFDWYLQLMGFEQRQVIESNLIGTEHEVAPTAFLDDVAAKTAVPGGGSVSAALGALGAALTSMVSRLTMGMRKYAEVKEEFREVLRESERLRARLTDLVAEDTEAFAAVLAAGKLPDGTDEEKRAKHEAEQAAYLRAAEVPLEVARTALEAAKLAKIAAEKGNVGSVSDAGVAALCAEAAVQGAAMNVYINLPSVSDEAARRLSEAIDDVITEIRSLTREVNERVYDVIGRQDAGATYA